VERKEKKRKEKKRKEKKRKGKEMKGKERKGKERKKERKKEWKGKKKRKEKGHFSFYEDELQEEHLSIQRKWRIFHQFQSLSLYFISLVLEKK